MPRTLSPTEARAFYDRLGATLDWQSFYEDPAMEALVRHGRLRDARRVFELGCGTGRLAERLLVRELPADAHYVGIDISPTMVQLASRRLARFGERAEVRLADGSASLPAADASCDYFLSTYVFDLLPDEMTAALLEDAYRILAPGGRLGAVSLTSGPGAVAGLVSFLWRGIHAVHPALVGGCRPIRLHALLPVERFAVVRRELVTSYGITSEVLVATRRPL